jgi:Rrf2 family protein
MHLSQACQYALLALTQLAEAQSRQDATPIPCSALAKLGQMPERFLLQILRTLVNNGIIRSTRGVDGGYVLAKDPRLVTVADVIDAIEGPITHQPALALAPLGKSARDSIEQALKKSALDDRERFARVKLAAL